MLIELTMIAQVLNPNLAGIAMVIAVVTPVVLLGYRLISPWRGPRPAVPSPSTGSVAFQSGEPASVGRFEPLAHFAAIELTVFLAIGLLLALASSSAPTATWFETSDRLARLVPPHEDPTPLRIRAGLWSAILLLFVGLIVAQALSKRFTLARGARTGSLLATLGFVAWFELAAFLSYAPADIYWMVVASGFVTFVAVSWMVHALDRATHSRSL